ncbi:MAG: hypothetical protein CML44_03710 [Rhodobacteraceae bacterium]|nr:hypothetical protein [Paracoccaceae bacterium]
MATEIISHDWNMPVPNDFLRDHSYSEGKSRAVTYDGPDKIWLQIGADGTEKYGPLTEDDMADGRPIPADVTQMFEVDCTEYPLICQLRGPVIDEKEETREVDDDIPHPDCPDMTAQGYRQFKYNRHLFIEDLYDASTVKVVDGVPTIHAFTVQEKMLGRPNDLTWDDIRSHRNTQLAQTDGQIAEDMPEDMKNTWKTYRQKLRDLPTELEAAGVSPNIAYYMFPDQPYYTAPPADPEPPADATADWAPPSSGVIGN